jgi:WhiB family transcriptional regulator, redox-sensing transcriptional regulator
MIIGNVAPLARHVPRLWVDCDGGPSSTELTRSYWQDRGACVDQGTQAWFVRNEGSHSAEAAKQICGGCPVRRDCLASALLFGEEYGIWGGLDRHQRTPLTVALREGVSLGVVLDQTLDGRSTGMDAA